MELHQKLRFLRYANDYSSAYVAYKLNITKKEYEQLESGEKTLSIRQAKQIGALYAMDAEELAGMHLELDQDVAWHGLMTNGTELPDGGISPAIEQLKDELNSIKGLLQLIVDKLVEEDK